MIPDPATRPRVLVAGVGNIFLGDDAFGVEVAQRLARRPLPEGVRVVDFGIRGLDLAYALLEGYEAVVLVDAAPRGGRPGTLYVLELEPPVAPPQGAGLMEGHNMDPARVLRLTAALGGNVGRVLLVGSGPEQYGADDAPAAMSAAVRAAVGEAVTLIESLLARLPRGAGADAAAEAGESNTIPAKEVPI